MHYSGHFALLTFIQVRVVEECTKAAIPFVTFDVGGGEARPSDGSWSGVLHSPSMSLPQTLTLVDVTVEIVF